MSRRWGGFLVSQGSWVPKGPCSTGTCLNTVPSSQRLSPAACPACWVLCRKHLHVGISVRKRYMSLSLSHYTCPEANNLIFLCLSSPATKMGLLILLPSTHTKLYPYWQWALCSKNQPLTQPAYTSWVTWPHPKSQEEPLAITVGT